MNIPSRPASLAAAGLTLIESDYQYFETAAQTVQVLGARLCTMPGYEDLPAGCIVTRADEQAMGGDPRAWTAALEDLVQANGSTLARFYLQDASDPLHQELIRVGYQPSQETGMVLDLARWTPRDDRDRGNLRLVDSEECWQAKRRLTAAGGSNGPDGYDMKSGRFADLERAKSAAGYMQAYLYYVQNKPAATICVAEVDRVARLKNLLVHPDFRHQGVGGSIVQATIRQYRDLGFSFVAAYADGAKSAIHIYGKQGLVPINHQTEWTKPLK